MRWDFSDTLTARDFKRHIPHSFELPAGCTRLRIRLHYTPPRVGEIRNMITLTLFDPDGFRGAGHRHGNTHDVEVTPTVATSGYHAGALPAGEWTVQLDTHMILPGADCPYSLTIEVDIETDTGVDSSANSGAGAPSRSAQGDGAAGTHRVMFDFVANPEAGWYRGDLHAHTWHSDAAWDVPDLVAGARQAGLDFVTLTDHNTTTPLAEMAGLASTELLTLGGMELTTFWGHAVCLGTAEWIDWRVDMAGDAMNRIAEAQYAAGNLFVIAHPQDEGDPFCTGCRWVYPRMRPGSARYVEVWNGRWGSTDPREKNEGSLGLWYDWLNAGHRLTATAGSDAHGPAHFGPGVGFNVIYADQLSQTALLDGLRKGQVYLSAGPALRFEARDPHGNTAPIGGTLVAQTQITLEAGWHDAPAGARLRLMRNGEVMDDRPIEAAGKGAWTLDVEPGHWFVLELRRDDGWMSGLTNPIFFE